MTESRIIKKGDNFKFLINGKEYPPVAYITYFEENNDYEKFAEQGFKLYSVTISFANKPNLVLAMISSKVESPGKK